MLTQVLMQATCTQKATLGQCGDEAHHEVRIHDAELYALHGPQRSGTVRVFVTHASYDFSSADCSSKIKFTSAQHLNAPGAI